MSNRIKHLTSFSYLKLNQVKFIQNLTNNIVQLNSQEM